MSRRPVGMLEPEPSQRHTISLVLNVFHVSWGIYMSWESGGEGESIKHSCAAYQLEYWERSYKSHFVYQWLFGDSAPSTDCSASI